MSLTQKTVAAFPNGRTTEELIVLAGAAFSHDKRMKILAELKELQAQGHIVKGRDGRWRPKKMQPSYLGGGPNKPARSLDPDTPVIMAANAVFRSSHAATVEETGESDPSAPIKPQALLRYWRSALRSDPRGATTQVADKHGIEWVLISGGGPISPSETDSLEVSINLDGLNPEFRQALARREGNENALALGWPIAVGRRGGVPVFQPVGLLAAGWERREDKLHLRVETDDVLVNPEWLRLAARASGWSHGALRDLFASEDGLGFKADEFLEKLKEAVASQVRGAITGRDLAVQLDTQSQGIFDSAALFLPSDSTFTAGAARDIDEIATWREERLARTALASVLGLSSEIMGASPCGATGSTASG